MFGLNGWLPEHQPLRGNRRYSLPTLMSGALHASPLLAAATGERTLARVKSRYNDSRVAQRGNVRTLYFVEKGAQYIESRLNLGHPNGLELDYARTMLAGYLINPATAKVLMVGFGGGQISNYLFNRGLATQIDGVDIDAEVIRLAREFFRVPSDPAYRTHVSDARAFLELRTGTHWDMIILDAFHTNIVPSHLKTAQFYELCRSRLSDGGVAVANLHNRTSQYAVDRESFARVFPHCYSFVSESGDQTSLVGQGGQRHVGPRRMRQHARALQSRFDFDMFGLAARYRPTRNWDGRIRPSFD